MFNFSFSEQDTDLFNKLNIENKSSHFTYKIVVHKHIINNDVIFKNSDNKSYTYASNTMIQKTFDLLNMNIV